MTAILTAFHRLAHLSNRKTAAKDGFEDNGDRKPIIFNDSQILVWPLDQ